MGKCLITKLNGSVSNDKLPRLGEMRFYFQKEDNYSNVLNHGIILAFAENTTISVFGGNFVHKTNGSNLGTTLDFQAGIDKEVFVSNENCYISVNKYILLRISSTNGESATLCSFSIDDLKYSSKVESIYYSGSKITGDIATLKNLNTLTNIRLINTKVTGDIANLSNLTALTNLDLTNTKVTGNIANLSSLTSLTKINLSSTQVTGNIAAFTNMSVLQELRLNVSTNLVLGELSSLPTNLLFYKGNIANQYTWNNTRSISYSVVALETVALSGSIDKALNDLASCTVKTTDSSPSWYKIINIIGTRTSASDAAVQTLQSKGYTVSITPA
jgi:hypothetical protein